MPNRFRALGALLLALPLLLGASHRSRNFAVQGPTPEVCRAVAERAEECRKAVAIEWLGRELPPWKQPCPIQVKVTQGEPGGVTSFAFKKGSSNPEMSVEGRLERILACSIPHEVTHTVFADALGGPMPRWADEGACLLAEDARERARHDRIIADVLAQKRDYPLSRLFVIDEYPRDIMGFYGQGYSVSRFLIETGGKPRFLRFVREGMQRGWDEAARSHYGIAGTRELDRAWRAWYTVVIVRDSSSTIARRGGGAPRDDSAMTVRAQSPSSRR